MNKPSHSVWPLENLESRQLLSASVPAIGPLLGVGSAVVAEPMVKTPNIVGTFKGTNTEVHPAKATAKLTVTVSSQTGKGKLTGTVASKGSPTSTFTGKLTGDSFKLTAVASDSVTSTITGTVSKNGKTLSGTWSNSLGMSGTFTVSR